MNKESGEWPELAEETRVRPRLIAALTAPASVRRYLQGVGLPTEPPPLIPPKAPPQQSWYFAT